MWEHRVDEGIKGPTQEKIQERRKRSNSFLLDGEGVIWAMGGKCKDIEKMDTWNTLFELDSRGFVKPALAHSPEKISEEKLKEAVSFV